MGWTKEQQQAIDLDNKNILVSAAAGSGKTAVLVERVVSHLLRPLEENTPEAEKPWSVDELLVVTFTKAAAAEMSDRIGQRLQKARNLTIATLVRALDSNSLIALFSSQSLAFSSATALVLSIQPIIMRSRLAPSTPVIIFLYLFFI